MMHGWGFYGGWFWGAMILRWVILAAIVAGVVWWLTGRKRPESDAMATLKRRLAAGEISEEEYTRLRELLK